MLRVVDCFTTYFTTLLTKPLGMGFCRELLSLPPLLHRHGFRQSVFLWLRRQTGCHTWRVPPQSVQGLLTKLLPFVARRLTGATHIWPQIGSPSIGALFRSKLTSSIKIVRVKILLWFILRIHDVSYKERKKYLSLWENLYSCSVLHGAVYGLT